MSFKNKILIIGTFVSRTKGSISRAEELRILLNDHYHIKLSSNFLNKFIRIVDIFFNILFFKGKLVIIDTYSGQAFIISEFSVRVCKLLGKRIVLILRGGILPEFEKKHPKRIKKLFQIAHEIYSPSRYLQQYFNQKGHCIHYLSNWVDLRTFEYIRNLKNPYSLLWVRAFSSIYDPKLAIHIVDKLKNAYPNLHLTMVGPDKGLLDEIKGEIKQLNLQSRIHIIGPVANSELPQFYQTHAVYLNTTKYESFGVALIEAAACGIPIISTPVGEIPFIWTDSKNILFANSVESFVQKISLIFMNQEIAADIAKQALENVHLYDWSIVKKGWVDMIEKNIR
jgi:glycosyltransferase involved in cell wall biosynthesis